MFSILYTRQRQAGTGKKRAVLDALIAGVVVPTLAKMSIRFTPGFCEAATGAVEHIDWRSYDTVGIAHMSHVPSTVFGTAEWQHAGFE